MKWQITLVNPDGKYKPVSTIVEADEKMVAVNKGIVKICQQRRWRNADRVKNGYTVAKARIYDKEKIDRENALKYAMIKHEKYKSGEWKKATV